MTIYIDIVLLENLCMNYIILFTTAHLLKIKKNQFRIIAAALLGGIYSILAYTQILKIYSNIAMKLILSVVIIYIAYNSKSLKTLIKQIIIFYLVSFTFGGCAFTLLYFIKPQEILMKNGLLVGTYPIKITLLGGIVGFVIVKIAFKIIKKKISKNDIYCKIQVFIANKQVQVKAIIDTGNMLKDPITKVPVIVIEKEHLYKIIPSEVLDNLENIIGGDDTKKIYNKESIEYMSKFRVIPFTSLGKQNGLLLGVKADKVIIEKDEVKQEIDSAIIGIYPQKLSKKDEYSALLGLDIMERSEENEFVANINK